jgi:hypothetical protein
MAVSGLLSSWEALLTKDFSELESRVYAVEHTIDRSDQIVQFVMVTGCLNPDIQIIPPDAPQLFQNTLHRCQHSIGIKPSNEINRYGTENEQKKYQNKHMILYLRSIVVPGKYQNYKITFIYPGNTMPQPTSFL